MFSAQLKPINKISASKMLLLVAGLVLVCLLIAMALVAGGQVQKAQLRQASQASLQAALANCLESQQVSVIKDCAHLAMPPTTTDPESILPMPHTANNETGTQGLSLLTLFKRY